MVLISNLEVSPLQSQLGYEQRLPAPIGAYRSVRKGAALTAIFFHLCGPEALVIGDDA